jgi:hypothetical protein
MWIEIYHWRWSYRNVLRISTLQWRFVSGDCSTNHDLRKQQTRNSNYFNPIHFKLHPSQPEPLLTMNSDTSQHVALHDGVLKSWNYLRGEHLRRFGVNSAVSEIISISLRNVTLLVRIEAHHPKTNMYSRIKSTKSPSFCMTTFSASLTNRTVLLPQSRDCSCYVSRYWHLHRPDCRNTLTYAHTISRTLPTSDSLGSLTLPAPEAGEIVELLLL